MDKEFGYNPFRLDGKMMRDMRVMGVRRIISENKDGMLAMVGSDRRVGDFEGHVRVYSMLYDVIGKLGREGIRMLGYVMGGMTQDKVYVNISVCSRELGFKSRSGVYKGLGELLRYMVLVKSLEKDVYWVNPCMMFKGSRVKWYVRTLGLDRDNELERVFFKDVLDVVRGLNVVVDKDDIASSE